MRRIFENTFIVGLLAWVSFVVVTDRWPASRWLEVRSFLVSDAVAGEPIRMAVDREIKSDFIGEWVVSVRDVERGIVCSAVGKSNYREGARLPDPLTLGWWTDGKCPTLPAGRYFVATDWTVYASGIWPEKNIRRDSNVFEVRQ